MKLNTYRKTIFLLATIVMLLPWAGCEQKPTVPSGVLHLGIRQGPVILDPRYADDRVSEDICRLIFSGLVRLDEEMKPVPDLAESWEVSELKDVYTVRLRRLVLFHEGLVSGVYSNVIYKDTPHLKAEDVVYTFKSIMDPLMGSPRRKLFRNIEQVEALDDYTVRFRLKQPDASFQSLLTQGIVPRAYAVERSPNFDRLPSGTGPFRLLSRQDDLVILHAFMPYDRYMPNVAEIYFHIAGQERLKQGILSGELDFAEFDPWRETVMPLFADEEISLQSKEFAKTHYLGLNMNNEFIKQKSVREALNIGVDRRRIVEGVMMGLGKPADSLLPPNHWAYKENPQMIDYDPEKSLSLLYKAARGFTEKDRFKRRVAVDMIVRNDPYLVRLAGIVASHYSILNERRKINFEVRVRPLGDNDFNKALVNGDYHLYYDVRSNITDPEILGLFFESESKAPWSLNHFGYSNPRFDEMMALAKGLEERSASRPFYHLAQDIVAKDIPCVFLWYSHSLAAMRSNIDGFENSHMGNFFSFRKVKLKSPE